MKAYINNFNLVTWPKNMAEYLTNRGHEVIFIDNNSTYEPLLDFYESCDYTVHKLYKNVGYTAPFTEGIVDTSDYYIISDPDMGLDMLPNDWEEKFISGIESNNVTCCGAFLDESTVPSSNPAYWYDQFYLYPNGLPSHNKLLPNGYIDTPVDTTFAVYRKDTMIHYDNSIRTDKLYSVKHLPWHIVIQENKYENSFQLEFDEEYYYYMMALKKSHHTTATLHRLSNMILQYEIKTGRISKEEAYGLKV